MEMECSTHEMVTRMRTTQTHDGIKLNMPIAEKTDTFVAYRIQDISIFTHFWCKAIYSLRTVNNESDQQSRTMAT